MVAYNGGALVADWSAPQVWPFSVASGAVAPAIALPSGTAGVAGAATLNSGTAFALTYAGELYRVSPASGAVKLSGFPATNVYTGVAPATGTSGAYSVAANGSVYGYSGTAASGTFGSPAWFAASSGTTLCSLLPALSGVGTFNMATAATGLIALPSGLASPSALTFSSGGLLAVAGWTAAPLLSGAAAGAAYPLSVAQMLTVGSGAARLWSASAYADAWSLSGTLSGLANLNAVAWRPDGAQALATSLVSGAVQALTYSVGALSLAQTLTVSGANSIVVAGDSLHALVCQSGQSQATPLLFGAGVWATGTAVTGLAGIVGAVASGASGACVAYASGLASVTLSGSAWTKGATIALPFVPTAVAADAFGQFYAAGSGAIAQVAGNAVVASGTWAGGAATSIVVNQGRIEIAVPSDGVIRTFGLAGSALLSGMATQAIGATTSGMALGGATLFTFASSGTALFGFSGTPFALTTPQYGAAGVYSGGAWSVYTFGAGHTPSALCFDASGKLQVATVQNTWWTLTSGAVFSASGVVPQYAGQAQSVPLGTAGLLSSGGHLYAATSLPGVLVEIV